MRTSGEGAHVGREDKAGRAANGGMMKPRGLRMGPLPVSAGVEVFPAGMASSPRCEVSCRGFYGAAGDRWTRPSAETRVEGRRSAFWANAVGPPLERWRAVYVVVRKPTGTTIRFAAGTMSLTIAVTGQVDGFQRRACCPAPVVDI
jgi:hypothetical protein